MKITVSNGNPIEIELEAIACDCGEIPKFHHGYGRTPYSINCSCGIYTSNEITCCTPEYGVESYNNWRINPENNKYNFKDMKRRK